MYICMLFRDKTLGARKEERERSTPISRMQDKITRETFFFSWVATWNTLSKPMIRNLSFFSLLGGEYPT